MMTMPGFAGLQRLGKALVLPIVVLPVVGLLLRLGQPDLLNLPVLAKAGETVFTNMPLIFAIGIAVGFARDGHGTAGLAGAIGYLVLTAVLKVMDDSLNMGVLSGIICGILAGFLYNRFKNIHLPPYLAYFGGKRFVPIVTCICCLVLGSLLGLLWPPVQHAIDSVGRWLIGAGAFGVFLYGALNRLLLVAGLHSLLNSLVLFVFGDYTDATGNLVHGDLLRYFAGDPSAGTFMAGFFPVMMFGLPAACLAMYRCAQENSKKSVGGLLLSMALTSILTGVTEPVEFAFMFLAPLLYLIHALLTGLSLALMHLLQIRLGFTFSAGLFDYLLSSGRGENPLLMLPVGVFYFVLYYLIFSYAIRKFDLKTLGRFPLPLSEAPRKEPSARARRFIAALGGGANLKSVEGCISRLRLELVDNARVDETWLKALGAMGMIRPGPGVMQVVVGTEAEQIADEIAQALAQGVSDPAPTPEQAQWMTALGGVSNIVMAETTADSCLRVEVVDATRADRSALRELGVEEVVCHSRTLLHLVLQSSAERVARQLRQ